eukprot:491260_1
MASKCGHMGCKCESFVESKSKWTKEKCKTCNHPQNKHKNHTMKETPKSKTVSISTNEIIKNKYNLSSHLKKVQTSTQSNNPWSEYIKTYGIEPQSAFQLMVFTESNTNLKSLTMSESRIMLQNNKNKSMLINVESKLNESKKIFNDIQQKLSKVKQQQTELKTNDNDEDFTEVISNMQYVGMDDSLQELVDCGKFDKIFEACKIGSKNTDKAILLCSSYSCTNTQLSAQNKASHILTVNKCRFEYIDGALIENKDRRNKLFKISNLKGKYPQIFIPTRTYSNLTCHYSKIKPPSKPQAPKTDARAYFSDLIIGPAAAGVSVKGIPYDTTSAYAHYSDYVGPGSYPKNREAFPNASKNTFDGIAIDANTRVILWGKENFEGIPLLDITGPALINNMEYKNSYPQVATATFRDAEMEKHYPPSVRIWSETNMNTWTNGSVQIVAAAK